MRKKQKKNTDLHLGRLAKRIVNVWNQIKSSAAKHKKLIKSRFFSSCPHTLTYYILNRVY